jgi:hypothetical protein
MVFLSRVNNTEKLGCYYGISYLNWYPDFVFLNEYGPHNGLHIQSYAYFKKDVSMKWLQNQARNEGNQLALRVSPALLIVFIIYLWLLSSGSSGAC